MLNGVDERASVKLSLDAIQRACAELRLRGIVVYEMHLDAKAFRELQNADRGEGFQRIYSADSEPQLRIHTCNGVLRLKKL